MALRTVTPSVLICIAMGPEVYRKKSSAKAVTKPPATTASAVPQGPTAANVPRESSNARKKRRRTGIVTRSTQRTGQVFSERIQTSEAVASLTAQRMPPN